MSISDITVAIAGGTQEERSIVGAVVGRSLTEAGFQSVSNTVRSQEGEVIAEDQILSMLDMARATSTEIFDRNITIEDGVYGADDQEDSAEVEDLPSEPVLEEV